jgi:hypothetical protein
LAIVAAFGFAEWLNRLRTRVSNRVVQTASFAVAVAIAAIVLWENGDGDTPLVPMAVPPVYRQVAADPSIQVICDFPVSDKLQLGNWYMYWQTVHGRTSVNGYLAHRSRNARVLLDQVASWNQIRREQVRILRDAGVDAIIVHDPRRESQLIKLSEIEEETLAPDGN